MSPHATMYLKGKLDNNSFHSKERMNLRGAKYLFGFPLGKWYHIYEISVHWNWKGEMVTEMPRMDGIR